MNRRKFIAITAAAGTASLAGCSSILDRNDTPPETPTETNTIPSREEIDENVTQVITEFSHALLEQDSETINNHLYRPELWPQSITGSDNPPTNLTVEITNITVELSDPGMSRSDLQRMAEESEEIDNELIQDLSETLTRVYNINIELSGEPDPATELDEVIAGALQNARSFIVTYDGGEWKIV